MLIEYFKKKKTDEDAHKVFYADFLEFSWNSKGGEKFWNKRKKANMFKPEELFKLIPLKENIITFESS
jgi:hypothetical protein